MLTARKVVTRVPPCVKRVLFPCSQCTQYDPCYYSLQCHPYSQYDPEDTCTEFCSHLAYKLPNLNERRAETAFTTLQSRHGGSSALHRNEDRRLSHARFGKPDTPLLPCAKLDKWNRRTAEGAEVRRRSPETYLCHRHNRISFVTHRSPTDTAQHVQNSHGIDSFHPDIAG